MSQNNGQPKGSSAIPPVDPFYNYAQLKHLSKTQNVAGQKTRQEFKIALKRFFISLIDIQNLPKPLTKASVINIILDHGFGVFFKADLTGQAYFLPVNVDHVDHQNGQFRKGRPKMINNNTYAAQVAKLGIYNKELKFFYEDPTKSTGFPFYFNFFGLSLERLIHSVLDSVSDIRQAQETNLINITTSLIIPVAPGQETAKMLEFTMYLNNLNAFKVLPSATSGKASESLGMINSQPITGATKSNTTDLWFDFDKNKKLAFEMLGIAYSATEKSQGTQESDTQALVDHFKTSAFITEMLDSLKQNLESMNTKFGWDIKVDINDKIKPLMNSFLPIQNEEQQNVDLDQGVEDNGE